MIFMFQVIVFILGVSHCLDLEIVGQTSWADAIIACDFKSFDTSSRAATILNSFMIYHPILSRREREISICFNCGNSQFTSYNSH